jgi:transcriptional regulator with XRE-family HTH domain
VARSDVDPRALGLAIRLRREELGFSRPDLAAAATLSYPYVYEVEQGKKMPSETALEKLAGALEIEPGRLRERAMELGAEKTLVSSADEVSVGYVSGKPRYGRRKGAKPRSETDELVERLTAAVVARIEPIVREAIASAVQEQP